MKKIFTTAFVLTLLISFLINMNCKKSEESVYSLFVTLHDGVTGTPETGTYNYNINDEVTYNYTPLEGYTRVRVYLDGTELESTGIITIAGNHYLDVSAAQGTGEFLLAITYGTGVIGTPESGSYYYDAGEQIDYSFSLEDGYTNLRVTLDGDEVGSTGTITISQDHTIYVYSEKEYYIQGSWTLAEEYDDGSSFAVTVTFTGDTENGTVVDSDGGTGTYTVSGGSVNFTIVYPDVTYEYTGKFEDEENMTGNSKRFYTSENTYTNGVWAAKIDTN